MVIAALILSIVSIIVTIAFAIVTLVLFGALISNTENQIITNTVDKDTSADINDFEKGFDTAKDHFWYVLQLSVFNLYRNMDILDFESLMSSIQDQMDIVINDEELRTEIIKELQKYYEGED